MIDNRNIMCQYELALEKYWATHGSYFTLAIKMALGMGITDVKLISCHGISEGSADEKISTRKYDHRTSHD